jgi:hypothetical protein
MPQHLEKDQTTECQLSKSQLIGVEHIFQVLLTLAKILTQHGEFPSLMSWDN